MPAQKKRGRPTRSKKTPARFSQDQQPPPTSNKKQRTATKTSNQLANENSTPNAATITSPLQIDLLSPASTTNQQQTDNQFAMTQPATQQIYDLFNQPQLIAANQQIIGLSSNQPVAQQQHTYAQYNQPAVQPMLLAQQAHATGQVSNIPPPAPSKVPAVVPPMHLQLPYVDPSTLNALAIR
uniref:Ras-interacting protein RIP3-like n=1 Tax=Saccoglossus kowalevskii TaxID=10224 RepID=A0ABM0MSA3_SACKO